MDIFSPASESMTHYGTAFHLWHLLLYLDSGGRVALLAFAVESLFGPPEETPKGALFARLLDGGRVRASRVNRIRGPRRPVTRVRGLLV